MNTTNEFDKKIIPSKYDKIGHNTLLEEHNRETLKSFLELP